MKRIIVFVLVLAVLCGTVFAGGSKDSGGGLGAWELQFINLTILLCPM